MTVAPGALAWSDPVELPYAKDPASPTLAGRKLAVSFTSSARRARWRWHAKAIQTSYVGAPKAGALGGATMPTPPSAARRPRGSSSSAIDVMAPADTAVVVCRRRFDRHGTGTTMNGDDRYPDALSRRRTMPGVRVSVVNAGIGGNRVVGSADPRQEPDPRRAASLDRLDATCCSSGVTAVI